MGKIVLFVAAFVALVALTVPAGASAAAWGVDDEVDTPVGQACPGFTGCSLREAVTSTELNAGPDAILVGTGTYPLTNGQLTVTQDLTVARVGAGGAGISGSESSRIFDVTGSGTDFILRFLGLSDGAVSGATARGGAIQGAAGTTIGIESSTISNSTVSALNDAQGGAIYSDGNVSIGTASGSTTGSSISNSSASVSGGGGTAQGGGVATGNAATLTVGARTKISANRANAPLASTAVGGGVYAQSGASFNGAEISGNGADGGVGEGGGVAINFGTGSFTRSTVSGNEATTAGVADGGGGGIAALNSDVSLQSSTVADNTITADPSPDTGATVGGGGVASFANSGLITATNSTISGNSSVAAAGSDGFAGGLYGRHTFIQPGGTILAENTQTTGSSQCDGIGYADIVSNEYNVLGDISDCSFIAGTGDVTGVTDAGLAPLDDYGGLTDTVMLELGSPALDIIPTADSLCTRQTTDQRGIARPQPAGGNCDSGSVEARPATLSIIPDSRSFPATVPSASSTANVAISNAGDLAMSAPPSPSVAAPFAYVSGCSSAVGPGSNCIMSLKFQPTAGGNFSRTLTVTSGTLSDAAALTGLSWGPTLAPSINGTPSVGFKTKVAQGKWPVKPTGYTFQWQRCDSAGVNCAAIPSATRNIYKPVSADLGGTLRVQEVATGPGGISSNLITTLQSAVVILEVPTVVELPAVKRSANPVVGTSLAAYHGQWTGAPTSYALQWVRCDADGTSNCNDIPSATKKSYTPTATDTGHTLRVSVAAGNGAGVSGFVSSPPSGVVG